MRSHHSSLLFSDSHKIAVIVSITRKSAVRSLENWGHAGVLNMYTNLSLSAYPMGRSYEVPSLENSSFDTNPQASSNSILKGSCRFPVSLSVSLLLFSHLPILYGNFSNEVLVYLKMCSFCVVLFFIFTGFRKVPLLRC